MKKNDLQGKFNQNRDLQIKRKKGTFVWLSSF